MLHTACFRLDVKFASMQYLYLRSLHMTLYKNVRSSTQNAMAALKVSKRYAIICMEIRTKLYKVRGELDDKP